MAIFLKQASRFSFGAETTVGTVAATKNKWLGIQGGECKFPFSDYEVREFRGGAGGRDALRLAVMQAKLEGRLNLVAQHAWPIYWFLGSVTDSGVGPYTHQIRGSNTRVGATLHQVLGLDDGTEIGIDWLGSLVDAFGMSVEENGVLMYDIGYKSHTPDDTATPQTVTAVDRDPYLFDGVTFAFYNPGTTNALTGLTAPTALRKIAYTGKNNLREIRAHRNSNARFPLVIVQGKREHDLTLTVDPADFTLYRKLIRDRTKFDFAYRLTRGTNDYIDFLWKDCFALRGPHDFPEEDGEIPVEVAIKPRVLQVDVVDSFATLIAAT